MFAWRLEVKCSSEASLDVRFHHGYVGSACTRLAFTNLLRISALHRVLLYSREERAAPLIDWKTSGRPKIIISDNGTSFVKAANESLTASLSDLRVKWKFSPPHGSHFGGAWERLTGMAKKALCATLRGNSCTDEVLATVFAEVEALLNRRPLCYIGDDHSNPEPLTPFMLLTRRPSVKILIDVSKHWCYAQWIADRFWQRWRKEYLPTLQHRSKWIKDNPNLEIGDVAAIVEPQMPRGHWPLGRITQVIKCPDGRVRIATVKGKSRSYVRPITRLAIMEELH
ncbi:hypothetical protein M513_03108 [Trichuris suis]|uniref:Integrase catalytic domain-containing protein n=1 Tax=Trichuris suis TaxID=68888 RepID=A0A085MFI8_9BILA|nr:hypothetical protein M513_03108 [Trichuris suis]